MAHEGWLVVRTVKLMIVGFLALGTMLSLSGCPTSSSSSGVCASPSPGVAANDDCPDNNVGK
jgi:hypothetical protein